MAYDRNVGGVEASSCEDDDPNGSDDKNDEYTIWNMTLSTRWTRLNGRTRDGVT